MPPFVWIIIGIVCIIIVWAIASYNSLIRHRALCEEAFSGMDVFMKKRYDLIPNLVATVKGYAAHESSTLEAVVAARAQALNTGTGTMESRMKSEANLSGALSRLMAIAEQYPELKADGQFLNLSNQLSAVETDISQARKYYNGAVRQLNTKIEVFPVNLIAMAGRFEKRSYFELDDTSERIAPKVDFS